MGFDGMGGMSGMDPNAPPGMWRSFPLSVRMESACPCAAKSEQGWTIVMDGIPGEFWWTVR